MYGVPRFNQFWLEVLHILNVSHSKSFTGDQLDCERFELNCLEFTLIANRILFPISLTNRKRGNLNIKPRFFMVEKSLVPSDFK